MKKTNIFLSSLALGSLIFINSANAAEEAAKDNERVLFKIHDISPEKDGDGNITSCNMFITFFNRYPKALSNTQLVLSWDDYVVDEVINQEGRQTQEALRRNPNADVMRYPTSGITQPVVSTTVKVPLINSNQQLTVKNKINTDRCFLLMNDMEVKASSCSFAGGSGNDRGCKAIFNYISPKDPQYYSEFKEISYEEEVSQNIKEMSANIDNNRELYNNIISTLRNIGK